jgi:hypothetical protein
MKGPSMLGVLVTFRFGVDYDAESVRNIARAASSKFVGLPGLRSKAFTLNPRTREARNFYVWESEEAAAAFFTGDLIERVGNLYGTSPSIEFVEVTSLVENGLAQ